MKYSPRISWAEAENYPEEHDPIQHAGLLKDTETIGEPLDGREP